jgi:hypothetical protein
MTMAIADIFGRLDAARSAIIDRAVECAKYTIPSVLPPRDWDESQKLPTPYQSVGARGVNQLTSKLALVMMPANVPFFKLSIAPALLKRAGISKAAADEILATLEQRVMQLIETTNLRSAVTTAIRDLIVTGNALLYVGKTVKTYRLHNYVVQRDAAGNAKLLIVKERIARNVLDDNLVRILEQKKKAQGQTSPDDLEQFTLWTMAQRQGDKWVVTQEIEDIPVKKETFSIETFPFLILRWSHVPGENYGRGLVEQYLGDLKTLESLYEALVSGAIQSSRVIWLVSPQSPLTPRDIQNAWNGDVLVGMAGDVSAVQLNKYADFQWIFNMAQVIEQRLAQIFFMVQNTIRNAERVTAEEVRLISQELEAALGGVYTLLTAELQKPLLRLLLNRLREEEGVDILDRYKDIIEVKIITGFAGIGRTEDFNRLTTFMQAAAIVPNAAAYIKPTEVLRQLAVSLGVDPAVVKTDEEMAQEMLQAQLQQQMAAMALQQAAGGVANGQIPENSGNA